MGAERDYIMLISLKGDGWRMKGQMAEQEQISGPTSFQ